MNNEIKLYPYQEEMMKKLNLGDQLRFAKQSFMNGRQYGKATFGLAQFLKPKTVEQTYIAKSIKKRYGIDLTDFEHKEIPYRDPFKQAMFDKMQSTIEESNRFIVSCDKNYYDLDDEMLNQTLFHKSEAYQRLMYHASYGLLAEKRLPIVTDYKA